MDRSGKLLTAALLRPQNLLAPGAGLLFALTPWGPWWVFPIAIVPYLLMVYLSVRDPQFIQRALATGEDVGEPIDWKEILEELGKGELTAPLKRIADNEKGLADQLATAPPSARGMMASTLQQLRTAGRMAIELARKVKALDITLASTAMNPEQSRWEAAERKKRAENVADPEAKRAFLDAAKSLEESAKSAEAMRTLRERTVAQLENLAASLESVAVRTIRLRVSANDGSAAANIGETLRVDMEAVKETLSVFEESVAMEEGAAPPSIPAVGKDKKP